MLSRRSFYWFALMVLTVIAGAVVDRARVDAACDHQCRMRYDFYYCDTGPCVELELPTCTFCVYVLGLCEDRERVPFPNCKDPVGPTQTWATYYNTCALLCSCQGSIVMVEATNLQGQGNQVAATRQTCQL